MKKISLIILSLICAAAFCFTACGTYTPPSTPPPDKPNTPGDTPGGDEEEENLFKTTLVCNGAKFIPQIEMSAQWSDGIGFYTAEFDGDGVATKSGLDGDYTVTLTNLPDGYTYNPNIYQADNDNREVEIELYPLIPTTGTGTDKYNNIINISQLGAYRVTFTEEGQQFYYQYAPTEPGLYAIESIIDVNANVVNPRVDVYVGTVAFKPEKPNYSIDGGGASSIYTKNFKYEVQVQHKFNVYAFAVKFSSRVGVPVNVDFIITRNGDIERPVTGEKIIIPQENFKQTPEYDKKEYVYTQYGQYSNGRYYLNGDGVVYNDPKNGGDGYYHLVNEDGSMSDTILYAELRKNPFINFYSDLLTLRIAGKNYYYLIRGYMMDGKDGDIALCGSVGGPLNIPPKIRAQIEALDRKSYKDYLNSDGVYAVTQEIREFLQDFSIARNLFLDGNGMCETGGSDNESGESGIFLDSSDENQWLFGCGYYAKR